MVHRDSRYDATKWKIQCNFLLLMTSETSSAQNSWPEEVAFIANGNTSTFIENAPDLWVEFDTMSVW